MLVSELIAKIHIAYKGKGTPPVPAEPKYEVYLSRANDNQDRWAEDPAIDNPDLFGGDIAVSLNIDGYFDLPEEVARITDPVIYAGKKIPVIPFTERHNVTKGAYVVGKKGERKLYIVNPANYPDNTFTVGVQEYAEPLENPTDDVTCNNTRWLALQTAAQLAEQDPAKEDLAPSLFSQATGEYREMLARSKKQLRGTGAVMRVGNTPRIGGL